MASGYEKAMKEVIPTIRYALVKELKVKYNKKEEDIARSLEVTQAAISKYLRGKISEKIRDLETRVDKELIDKYAKRIAGGDKEAANICICTACKAINDFGCKFSSSEKSVAVVAIQ